MSTVLVAFSHRQSGADFAVRLLRGMVYNYYAFATFCLVLALALPNSESLPRRGWHWQRQPCRCALVHRWMPEWRSFTQRTVLRGHFPVRKGRKVQRMLKSESGSSPRSQLWPSPEVLRGSA